MTPDEVLADIEQRVDRMTRPDPTGQYGYAMSELGHIAPDTYLTEADRAAGDFDCIAHIAQDLRRLTATVWVVLGRHKPWVPEARSQSTRVHCEACHHSWPCPDYRNVRDALGAS